MSIRDLDALFCSVDAFWQQFEPVWEQEQLAAGRQRRRATRLHPSEIMTILILFQQSGYRTFKGFYTQYVQVHLRAEFPHLVSYNHFVALMPRVFVPLAVYLQTCYRRCMGNEFHRLDGPGGLSSGTDPLASRLSRRCPPRQDLSRLVL